MNRKDSDLLVHSPSMAWVLISSFLVSLWSVEGTCDQQIFFLDCADAQTDLRKSSLVARLVVGFVVRWFIF